MSTYVVTWTWKDGSVGSDPVEAESELEAVWKVACEMGMDNIIYRMAEIPTLKTVEGGDG